MKYVQGMTIIREVLKSWDDYEILPAEAGELLQRMISDLKYQRELKADNLAHFRKHYDHLFEKREIKTSAEIAEEGYEPDIEWVRL